MTPRDRVLSVLQGKPADRIPWIEHGLDRRVIFQAFDLGPFPDLPRGGIEYDLAVVELDKRINRAIGLCNLEVSYRFSMAPRIRDPHTYAGLITDEASLDKLVMPDLTPQLWDDLQRLIDAKDEFAMSVSISTGIGHIWQTMEMEAFAIACRENHALLRTILERYTEWTCRVLDKVQTMGIDFVWSFDDFAFKTGPVYSPAILREIVLPYARQIASRIKLPWIFHSDGNLMDVLDDLVPLGMSALNPIEHGCIDVPAVRARHPHLTLIGNVDLGLLARGTPDEVRQFVREMFREMNVPGRYIPASGNSIPHYSRPENVRAMVEEMAKCAEWI